MDITQFPPTASTYFRRARICTKMNTRREPAIEAAGYDTMAWAS